MGKRKMMDMFQALLYLIEVAEEEHEYDIAKNLQKVAERVFMRFLNGK